MNAIPIGGPLSRPLPPDPPPLLHLNPMGSKPYLREFERPWP